MLSTTDSAVLRRHGDALEPTSFIFHNLANVEMTMRVNRVSDCRVTKMVVIFFSAGFDQLP